MATAPGLNPDERKPCRFDSDSRRLSPIGEVVSRHVYTVKFEVRFLDRVLCSCREAWSSRLPVTEKIAGSNPVRSAFGRFTI